MLGSSRTGYNESCRGVMNGLQSLELIIRYYLVTMSQSSRRHTALKSCIYIGFSLYVNISFFARCLGYNMNLGGGWYPSPMIFCPKISYMQRTHKITRSRGQINLVAGARCDDLPIFRFVFDQAASATTTATTPTTPSVI